MKQEILAATGAHFMLTSTRNFRHQAQVGHFEKSGKESVFLKALRDRNSSIVSTGMNTLHRLKSHTMKEKSCLQKMTTELNDADNLMFTCANGFDVTVCSNTVRIVLLSLRLVGHLRPMLICL